MNTYDEEAKKHQEGHIRKLRSRKQPQTFEIEGVEIIVNTDVFAPASDTRILAKYIKVGPNNSVLDLTTGSGIIAAIAAKQGANVTAIDILYEAICNANDNFRRLGLSVVTIQSDMFERIPPQKFDFIFVNGPYFEGEIQDPLEYASLDLSNFLEKLFSRLNNYLSSSGKLLITFAEFGEIETFYEYLNTYGFHYHKIDSRTSSDGKRTYSLFEVTSK